MKIIELMLSFFLSVCNNYNQSKYNYNNCYSSIHCNNSSHIFSPLSLKIIPIKLHMAQKINPLKNSQRVNSFPEISIPILNVPKDIFPKSISFSLNFFNVFLVIFTKFNHKFLYKSNNFENMLKI